MPLDSLKPIFNQFIALSYKLARVPRSPDLVSMMTMRTEIIGLYPLCMHMGYI